MRWSNVSAISCWMLFRTLHLLYHTELISCMENTSLRRRKIRIPHFITSWRCVCSCVLWVFVRNLIVLDQTTERLPESRKLELNGYLTKPTTRLARYPLLLEAVLKHTPDDNPDKQTLPQVIRLVREFLAKVNVETGRTENRFNLLQLDQQLVFRPGEQVVSLCRRQWQYCSVYTLPHILGLTLARRRSRTYL